MSTNWHGNAIALTGNIGTGKSTVAKMLQQKGAWIIDADSLAKKALEPGSEGHSKVIKLFGPHLRTFEGPIDRKTLAKVVFNDETKRKQLENIVHPIVRDQAANEASLAIEQNAPLIVYDVPLLFETDLWKEPFIAIVVVYAPAEVCELRLQRSRGISSNEIRRRQAAQLSISDKAARADYVINNQGSVAETQAQIDNLWPKLLAAKTVG